MAKRLCGDDVLTLASLIKQTRIYLNPDDSYHSGGVSPLDASPVVAMFMKRTDLADFFASIELVQRIRGLGGGDTYAEEEPLLYCVQVIVCLK